MTMTQPTPTVSEVMRVAIAHHNAGRLELAAAAYAEVLRGAPDYAEASRLLGLVALQSGNPEGAIELFKRALSLEPSSAWTHNNLGIAYQIQGNLQAALDSFRKAVVLDPEIGDSHNRLGVILHLAGRYGDALASYQRALALNANDAEVHLNIGNAHFSERRFDEAESSYRRAQRANPRLAQVYSNLGNVLQTQGDAQAAVASFAEALACKPDFVEARWAQAMSTLPLVYGNGESPDAARAEFARSLGDLEHWFDANPDVDGQNAVGRMQPFILAYQEKDNRALLSQYGDLCARLMQDWWRRCGPAAPGAPPPGNGKIRVGIVSAHVGDHSVWNAIGKGWCQHLDRDRFSLHVFHLGMERDAETEYVRANAAHFEQAGQGLRGWVEAILRQRVDVLIYPEVGMDPMTLKLACLRLARVQAASWGHPETTGLPTIDYYISAQDMEPANADTNYRERLVMLPHLGCCYRPLVLPDVEVDFSALGIASDVPSLLCPGTAFKYPPYYDATLVAIARGIGRCQFVFCMDRDTRLAAKLQRRLERSFSEAGLNPHAHLVFIPWQPRPVFRRLLERADVYLDTIGFSGFNTVMQAIECALPVVTLEGKFLRGRFGSGILRRIGLDECVAMSVDDYIGKAVRLGSNAGARQELREKIIESRRVLFNDLAPVRALETFLDEVAVTR